MEQPLSAQASAPAEIVIPVNGKQLRATVAGRGPEIVLLHSLLTDQSSFDPVFASLAEAHRVVLVSLPGFGASDVVRGGLDVVADHLALALDAGGLAARPVVIGNGYGAFLATVLAIRHPHLVGKLVLAGCGAAFSDSGRAAFRQMAAGARARGLQAVADTAMARLFSAQFREGHPQLMARRRACFLAISPDTFDDACNALATLDLRADLRKVGVPVMVMVGDDDEATPPAMARELAAALPDARLRVLPGCAHVPQLQDPDGFLAAIRAFVGF
ncbi:MAG: alpha/beta fold hydrolase [Candidimonas sp.]|nr:MAG: alpha/beta fold hydrolase [Candidimonas sp.]